MEVQFKLNPMQFKKYLKCEPFTLKHNDITVGGDIDVDLHCKKSHLTRIKRAVAHGKGFRVSKEMIHGGDVGSWFRNIGNKISAGWHKTFNPKLGNNIVGELKSVAKPVVKGIVNAGVGAAATLATGNPLAGAVIAGGSKPVLDRGIDAGFAKVGMGLSHEAKIPNSNINLPDAQLYSMSKYRVVDKSGYGGRTSNTTGNRIVHHAPMKGKGFKQIGEGFEIV